MVYSFFHIFSGLFDDTVIGIVVMLNNYFHDFAVAMLFVSLLVLRSFYRVHTRLGESIRTPGMQYMYAAMNRVIFASWVFIILGGVIRTLAYEQYEWSDAAGRGQIAALVVKHILLISLVIAGTILQIRLKKIYSTSL